ncbi:hypothetical protein UO65_1615 [Actinokineospora spheciospongiae]|uniref:Uncharacterized protein n=1 Tax=Actinokineospora spheciospongiae TaxID=909613 RepID=W7J249_9PSEU|nr:hypothetical protein UO65_1615 [Actinokineospora spheciospongiae]
MTGLRFRGPVGACGKTGFSAAPGRFMCAVVPGEGTITT